ncbi:MAG: radical SAM protein [Myxococcales bacterium]|nr:radical SAM protein [Myxococcales bacterium]
MTAGAPWLHPVTGQAMRRLEFHITYYCPERCTFCSEETRMAEYSSFPVTFGRVARVLREQAERGVEAVHFTGGEPTIHPQFVEILQLAKKLGMRTSIGTIGTRLADPEFAARALPYLDEGLFSLHGPDVATHDAQTRRAGSFDRLERAMANARAHAGFRLFVNTVLVRQNAARIVETAALARARGAELLVVSNVTPEGAGENAYADLTLRLDEVRPLVRQIIAEAGPMIVRFFGLPVCALGADSVYANDLHWNPRVTFEWARHPDRVSLEGIYSWTPDRKRAQPAVCGSCSWNRLCHGVFARYVELYGSEELVPMVSA